MTTVHTRQLQQYTQDILKYNMLKSYEKSEQHDDSLLVDESCCMVVCVNVYSTAYQLVIMSHIIIKCDVS